MAETKTYSDAEIAQFAEFAEAVIWSAPKAEKFGANWPTAYWQYYVEVLSNISGMRDNPREFFESDLKLRKEWGDHIINDYHKYMAEVETEEAAKTEEPQSIKAIREELEAVKAELQALKALKEADTEAEAEEAPEAEVEDEAEAEADAEEAEEAADDTEDEEEAAEEEA